MHNLYPKPEQAFMLEDNLDIWHSRMEELMVAGTRIIALRGAGSANGIEPTAADAITEILYKYVAELTESGTPVALMYDGDEDVRENPYLGSVFGVLADSLASNPSVTTIAVQTKNWYEPKTEGSALASVTGTQYETYVFNKDMPEIGPNLQDRGMAHSALTQSEALVLYPNYEQIIIGAAGLIAGSQLHDLAAKALGRSQTAGPVPVTLLVAPINPNLDERLRYTAQHDPSETRRARAADKIIQRQEYPYGVLCSPEGEFNLNEAEYTNISFKPILLSI